MDAADIAKFERTLAEFAEATGKTAEDGMKRIAKASCKRLARRCSPTDLRAVKKWTNLRSQSAIKLIVHGSEQTSEHSQPPTT